MAFRSTYRPNNISKICKHEIQITRKNGFLIQGFTLIFRKRWVISEFRLSQNVLPSKAIFLRFCTLYVLFYQRFSLSCPYVLLRSKNCIQLQGALCIAPPLLLASTINANRFSKEFVTACITTSPRRILLQPSVRASVRSARGQLSRGRQMSSNPRNYMNLVHGLGPVLRHCKIDCASFRHISTCSFGEVGYSLSVTVQIFDFPGNFLEMFSQSFVKFLQFVDSAHEIIVKK